MRNYLRTKALAAYGITRRTLRTLLFGDQKKRLIEKGILAIGKHTYGNPQILYGEQDRHRIIIGAYCAISPDVTLIPGTIHPPQHVSGFPFRIFLDMPGGDYPDEISTRRDLVIGNDVWIGAGAMILAAHVGDGAIIAARSVVAGRVPPYTVFGGNPARLLYYRFSKDRIDKLLAIRWWDWDEDKIIEAVPLLESDNVDAFIEKYYPAAGK